MLDVPTVIAQPLPERSAVTTESSDNQRDGQANLFRCALDLSLSRYAILDEQCRLMSVNRAWGRFAEQMGVAPARLEPGQEYLAALAETSGCHPDSLPTLLAGFQEVVNGAREAVYLEYPGRPPFAERWFSVRYSRFRVNGVPRLLVVHDDVTRQRLAEQQIERLKQEMEEQAGTDSLTGIPNRRGLDRTLEQEWKRNERTQTPLSIAVLDVDFFKQYNDHFGHLGGDNCLKAVAQTIRINMRRPGDFGARYGGEEFAVILPNTPPAGAYTVLQNIIEDLRALKMPHPKSQLDCRIVTISIGFSTAVPNRYESPLSLVREADDALYAAKRTGRNRLVCYNEIRGSQTVETTAHPH